MFLEVDKLKLYFHHTHRKQTLFGIHVQDEDKKPHQQIRRTGVLSDPVTLNTFCSPGLSSLGKTPDAFQRKGESNNLSPLSQQHYATLNTKVTFSSHG